MTPIFELSSKLFPSSDIRGCEQHPNHALRSGPIVRYVREPVKGREEGGVQRKWGMGQIISRVLAIWNFPPGAKKRTGHIREGKEDVMDKNRRSGGKEGH